MSHRIDILNQIADLRVSGKLISASRAINTIPRYISNGESIIGFAECAVGSKPGVIALSSTGSLIILSQGLLTTTLHVSIPVQDITEMVHIKDWHNNTLTIDINNNQIELDQIHPVELSNLLEAFSKFGITPLFETSLAGNPIQKDSALRQGADAGSWSMFRGTKR